MGEVEVKGIKHLNVEDVCRKNTETMESSALNEVVVYCCSAAPAHSEDKLLNTSHRHRNRWLWLEYHQCQPFDAYVTTGIT